MSKPTSSVETLQALNRALEAALQEANETLDAIRNGEVDAVVVGGPHGQVVYTLENADRPYRVLVEQMREYLLTGSGIKLIDPYIGPNGVLTGAARQAQEARERSQTIERLQLTERRGRELDRRRASIERQIAELRAGLEADQGEVFLLAEQEAGREEAFQADRMAMAVKRGAAQ